jgi:hypothetical protein
VKKKLLIPPMLADLVDNALASMDGVKFTDLEVCPSCGGPVTGHDCGQSGLPSCSITGRNGRSVST